MLTRALLAFLALPGVVAFAVPLLLAWPVAREGSFQWIAIVPLAFGAVLLVWSAREFYVAGKGTLAPWSPPRHLVSSGPYRVSRNPMYAGVGMVLLGWAIGFRSATLLVYALVLTIAFHLRIVRAEEPSLARTHRDAWTRYAARVPRWIFPTRRALVTSLVALAVALPIAGLIYEALADAAGAREFPAPGMLVDVGGRRLHLLCIGEGGPIVLFESSGWGSAISSAGAREPLANRTNVCSYDRRGKGWSDGAPGVATAATLAQDLAVLQDRAGLRPPLLIVTASIGGLTTEMFARQFPERVAGLVFVDAASSLALPALASRARPITAAACTAGVLSHFGIVRLLDPFDLAVEGDEGRRGAAITYHARSWGHACAMARGLEATTREFAAVPPLRSDLPLTVLSASSAEDLAPPALLRIADVVSLRTASVDAHRRQAKASSRGTWQMVPDSTHLIGNSRPDAIVEAVLDMLEVVR
jgi:protein-S-isoprenylcysteine O-methyltransferase Ste14/pimeloyl-ACP methyl ester carboxylesterase